MGKPGEAKVIQGKQSEATGGNGEGRESKGKQRPAMEKQGGRQGRTGEARGQCCSKASKVDLDLGFNLSKFWRVIQLKIPDHFVTRHIVGLGGDECELTCIITQNAMASASNTASV